MGKLLLVIKKTITFKWTLKGSEEVGLSSVKCLMKTIGLHLMKTIGLHLMKTIGLLLFDWTNRFHELGLVNNTLPLFFLLLSLHVSI